MPSADFWQAIRNPHRPLSPYSGTPARPPGVSSPAFSTQPLDLQPEPLMDMGLSVKCPLARLGMPPIQFLFVGSRLCSTLLSDTLLRDRCPCASLRLHLHQVGEGTSTPKLMNMPSTPKKGAGGIRRPFRFSTRRRSGLGLVFLEHDSEEPLQQDANDHGEVPDDSAGEGDLADVRHLAEERRNHVAHYPGAYQRRIP